MSPDELEEIGHEYIDRVAEAAHDRLAELLADQSFRDEIEEEGDWDVTHALDVASDAIEDILAETYDEVEEDYQNIGDDTPDAEDEAALPDEPGS